MFCATAVNAKTPNDPQYNLQEKMWKQIGAPLAWDYTVGSKKVVVATIDTGADTWHSDLRDNIWTNPYEISDNGYDDDGNGYVDDVHGWNFIDDNNVVRPSVQDTKDDPEAIRHGTIIAGLIGASGNNGKNGTGINWNVSIMPLRAIESDGTGSFGAVAKAVKYAVDNGADVISLSVVSKSDDAYLKSVLYDAYKKGVVIVAAAGNDQIEGDGDLSESQSYPVCEDYDDAQDWIIGVSSVNNSDKLSRFANYGSCVDLVAPGQGIYSIERYAPMFGYNEDFGGSWSGTSFATPLVAGSAALLKSMRPDWGPKEIISTLLKNSDNIDSLNTGFSHALGFGRLNIGRAVINAYDGPIEEKIHPSQAVFSFVKNNVYIKPKNKTKRLFSTLSNVKIIVIDSFLSENLKRDELTVLVKRGKYYYLQFFNDKGRKWHEIVVPTTDYGPKATPQSVKLVLQDSSRRLKVVFKDSAPKIKKNKIFEKYYDWPSNE